MRMTDAVQEEICRRIDAALAAGVHDHLGYEALARVKLPGEDYLAVLRRIHALLKPEVYVEIGVRRGESMACALPRTWKVGVDPSPGPGVAADVIATMASDVFFSDSQFAHNAVLHPAAYRGLFDLALIDGDHSYEQARRDFENLLARRRPGSVILLHDVIPMDARTASPRCQSSFWTGDVWRLMREIVADFADCNAFTIACPPTGLGVVICDGPPPVVRQLHDNSALVPPWGTLRSWLSIVKNDWAVVEHLLRPAAAARLTEEVA
jgi:hypothetical protein